MKDSQSDIQELKACAANNDDKVLEKNVIEARKNIGRMNYTLEDAYNLLREVAPECILLRDFAPTNILPDTKRADSLYSWGISRDFASDKYDDSRYWANPLEAPLPNAPD